MLYKIKKSCLSLHLMIHNAIEKEALLFGWCIYVSDLLNTGRIMAKTEDLCLHCGLCAERCPTNAWDMRKYLFDTAKAVDACQS